MVSKLKRRINQLLLDAQVTIDNTLADAGVLAALSEYGYDEAKLREGRALYEEAYELVNQQRWAHGERLEATVRLKAAWNEARAAYRRALKVARIAFRDEHKAVVALKLRGVRERRLAAWLLQAKVFYGNLLSKSRWLATMAEYGFDRERLEAEQALLQEVRRAGDARRAAYGGAVQATIERDAKLRELNAWLADFRVIAGVAKEERS